MQYTKYSVVTKIVLLVLLYMLAKKFDFCTKSMLWPRIEKKNFHGGYLYERSCYHQSLI